MKTIKWIPVGAANSNMYRATVEVGFINQYTKNVDKVHTVPMRIDGRRPGVFRVDMASFGIWEAIDGGPSNAPTSFKDAKVLAEKWCAEAAEKGTLTPF